MLAAIIMLLEDQVQPQPQPRRINIDLGGGGGGPNREQYDIVDYLGALDNFEEVPGEPVTARDVRRRRHVVDMLPAMKRAREAQDAGGRGMAAAMLMGAGLQAQADAEQMGLMEAEIDRQVLELDTAKATISRVYAQMAAAEAEAKKRAEDGNGKMLAGLAIGAGVGIALMLLLRKR
jgi:hypothetical protein